MTAAADRHLLLGLLALQNGLINQGQLVAAFQAWTLDKSKSLADHLQARGELDPDDRAAVEALVTRHIKRHGGDVEKSLAAVPAGKSTRRASRGSATRTSRGRSATWSPGTSRRRRATSTPQPPTPLARPPAAASGSACCGRMPRVVWAPCSWHWTAS